VSESSPLGPKSLLDLWRKAGGLLCVSSPSESSFVESRDVTLSELWKLPLGADVGLLCSAYCVSFTEASPLVGPFATIVEVVESLLPICTPFTTSDLKEPLRVGVRMLIILGAALKFGSLARSSGCTCAEASLSLD
jgi:hypothetical protein